MSKQYPHKKRRERLIRKFRKAGIDGLLVTSVENVRYLSGFRGEDSALLVTRTGTALLTDSRYDEQAGQECAGIDILVRKKSLMQFAARTCLKADVARLGVESANLTLAQHEALSKEMKSATIVSSSGLVEKLRLIKDRAEIATIERAAAIAEEGFRLTVARIRPGMTEIEVANLLNRTMLDLGAEKSAFPTIVAAGARSSLPHAIPTRAKICRKSAILFDWGARVDGYNSDLTRLVFIDRISPLFKRLYEVVLGAQQRAIKCIAPGREAGEVDSSARAFLKAHRHNKFFTHGLGHGLGLQVHEAPSLSSRSTQLLKPGMVCTVEPGVYLAGRGGVRIEDDVLVTRTGYRVLTNLPKALDSFLISS
jgi:Xaa-Pro aminopeptidase